MPFEYAVGKSEPLAERADRLSFRTRARTHRVINGSDFSLRATRPARPNCGHQKQRSRIRATGNRKKNASCLG